MAALGLAMLRIDRIYLYPVKGARRVSLKESVVKPYGLRHDRRWALVDARGKALSQRQHAKLALVRAAVTPSGLSIEGPGMDRIAVAVPSADGDRRRIVIWSDSVDALDGGRNAAGWFEAYLGAPCRLVYMDRGSLRSVDTAWHAAGGSTTFSDGYPLLLTSTASLAALNARLSDPLSMTRFRPNLVVAGGDSFAEDGWSLLGIGEMTFHVVKPCTRCVVTTVDQETGISGKEPLRTLKRMRRRGSKVFFGENLIPRAAGIVRVGDRVEVLARRRDWPVRT